MIELSEEQESYREALRRFIEAEIAPNLAELEHGDTPPYDVLRKLFDTFGIAEMQRLRYESVIKKARAAEAGESDEAKGEATAERAGDMMGLQMILTMELSRYCPGMVTAMGVSVGLTSAAILSRGTLRQKERWALPLLTLEKIGAWAITEPGSGSDAFGGMKASAKRDGQGGYILNGTKTFITNGPYADTIVFICKLDDGSEPKERKILSFVLDRDMPGLELSRPMRKMGLHSSPTGEVYVSDLRAEADRLLGESEDADGRSGAKETFGMERAGVVAMALGIVDRALGMCVKHAREREQFGRPIGEFQLIQLKLAKMEIARVNLENLFLRQIETARAGRRQSLAEASAGKLYAAQVAVEVTLEAVQLFGGSGYMAESEIEQLCRDAKVLQIYGGTDEIQVTHIARDLLNR